MLKGRDATTEAGDRDVETPACCTEAARVTTATRAIKSSKTPVSVSMIGKEGLAAARIVSAGPGDAISAFIARSL
jgi:hypothetical protein